jgi:hypothetical protein
MEVEFERVLEQFDKPAKPHGDSNGGKDPKGDSQNANESTDQIGPLLGKRNANKSSDLLKLYFMQVIHPHSQKISLNLKLIEKITKLLYEHVKSPRYDQKDSFGYWKTFIDKLGKDNFKYSYARTDISPKDAGKTLNLTLKNRKMVFERSENLQKCTVCSAYVPDIYVGMHGQTIVSRHTGLEIGSRAELFTKLLMKLPKEMTKNESVLEDKDGDGKDAQKVS